jgi:hypothetical protein
MGFDDGPADRQANSHTARLRRVEGLEDALYFLYIEPDPVVLDAQERTGNVRVRGDSQ